MCLVYWYIWDVCLWATEPQINAIYCLCGVCYCFYMLVIVNSNIQLYSEKQEWLSRSHIKIPYLPLFVPCYIFNILYYNKHYYEMIALIQSSRDLGVCGLWDHVHDIQEALLVSRWITAHKSFISRSLSIDRKHVQYEY